MMVSQSVHDHEIFFLIEDTQTMQKHYCTVLLCMLKYIMEEGASDLS